MRIETPRPTTQCDLSAGAGLTARASVRLENCRESTVSSRLPPQMRPEPRLERCSGTPCERSHIGRKRPGWFLKGKNEQGERWDAAY